MAADRVLTERELNRAVLARQLLLERDALPVPAALTRVGGIQAQYAPSMYLGLWSRLAGFARAALTEALHARTVVQATLMRVTIHLVAPEDFWPIALATREAGRAIWLRTYKAQTAATMAAAAEQVRAALAAHGTLRRADVEALVGKEPARGVGLWVDLVRVPPSGTWERRRADVFALADDWLGPPPPEATAASGVELLVRRYLTAFGPAHRTEIADWAGLKVGDVRPALDRLELRRFADEAWRELVDLPGLPLPAADTPAPVRLLPTWDATLLTHCRRTQILPEEHRPKVFGVRMPQSHPTFLVDGQVAGRWRIEEGRPVAEPFARLDRAAARALDDELARVAAFHEG